MESYKNKRRVFFFKDYLIKTYAKPLYRVPINLGFGCPHKNKNSNGCIFCSESGALARHLKHTLDLEEQISEGVRYVKRRYDPEAKEFIAYLQSYTNTFSDIDTLKKHYEKILSHKIFKVLIVSTRADSISDETYAYLEEISKRIDLIVELGVQSSNDKTLERINRKHSFEAIEIAAKKLTSLNIKTVAHIIIGLPNESFEDYEKTISDIVSLGFWGLKIHNLLIVKNSDLGTLYKKIGIKEFNTIHIPQVGNIPIINEYEYINILIKLITKIPNNMPILRLTADEDHEKIIEPKWRMSKGEIISSLIKTMEDLDLYQGEFKANKDISDYLKVETDDKSLTFYNNKYKQCYHSKAGAKSEAFYKFINPSSFDARLKGKEHLKILDIGFGLGYNAIEAIKEAKKINKNLEIISLELDKKSIFLAESIYDESSFEKNILSSLYRTELWTDGKSSLKVLFGDARKTVSTVKEKFDLIYLDPFSQDKNPELWTYDFIKELSNLLLEDGAIITYSASFSVRGAMIRNKLFLGYTEAFGRKNGGTIATKTPKVIISPLSEKDCKIILETTSGAAYRDPLLSSSYPEILKKRQKLISKLKSKGIQKWI